MQCQFLWYLTPSLQNVMSLCPHPSPFYDNISYKYWIFISFFYVTTCITSFCYLSITCNAFISVQFINDLLRSCHISVINYLPRCTDRQFSIRSHDNPSLVIPNNQTIDKVLTELCIYMTTSFGVWGSGSILLRIWMDEILHPLQKKSENGHNMILTWILTWIWVYAAPESWSR